MDLARKGENGRGNLGKTIVRGSYFLYIFSHHVKFFKFSLDTRYSLKSQNNPLEKLQIFCSFKPSWSPGREVLSTKEKERKGKKFRFDEKKKKKKREDVKLREIIVSALVIDAS